MIVMESASRLSISETPRKHKVQECLWAFQRRMTETKLASFYEIWYNDYRWGLKS